MRHIGLAGAFLLTTLTMAAYAGGDAGAYLDLGGGARGSGLGGAYTAMAGGTDAAFWNPAGLLRSPGVRVETAVLPMSLDRLHNSVAASVNVRGDMAFGLAWIHAGVGDLQGRTGNGQPTGRIEDAENAFFFSVARTLGQRLSLGLGVKILDQRLDVPGWEKAEATGHGVDLGIQYHPWDRLWLGAAVRNLGGSLEWTVARSSTQASNTTDDLRQVVVLGAGFRPLPTLLLTVDVAQEADTYASAGAEWTVSELLTVRGGARRLPGDEATPEALTAGLSLRPMRTDALLFHYAFMTDPLDAGDRSVFGLTLGF